MPPLLYLDDGKHLGKGVLSGGHGGQEAEEMVSRRIREHLEIVGRVLWAKHRSGRTAPLRVLYSGSTTFPKPVTGQTQHSALRVSWAASPRPLETTRVGLSLQCLLSPPTSAEAAGGRRTA